MKEIPILFSTPMVQAILDGRKTMTRRIVKTTQNGWDAQSMEYVQIKNINSNDLSLMARGKDKPLVGVHAFFKAKDESSQLGIKCRYGQPGDILWVRESFAQLHKAILFKANTRYYEDGAKDQKFKPSIHMPKNLARIWLQVAEIRVERLQNITEEDAVAEGVQWINRTSGICYMNYEIGEYIFPSTAKKSFKSLWIKINGPESWDANPWVWVVKFKVLSTTGRPELETLNLKPETL